MSTADQNVTPEKAYRRILHHLSKLSAHHRRVKITFGLGLMVSAALAAAIFCLGLDALFFFAAPARQALLLLSTLVLFLVLMRFVLFPLVKGPNQERMARLADGRFPQMRNGLVTALQLWKKKVDNLEGYSNELIDAAVVSAEWRSRDLNLLMVVDRSGAKRILRLGAGLLGLALLLFVLFPTPLRSSALRFSHPRTRFQQPPRTQLLVTPGDLRVTRHSDVQVIAEIQGKVPQEVRIGWKEGQANWREESCQRREERRYGHLFPDVKRDILYQLEAGDAQSPQYRITVIDRPRVVKLRLRYQFPTYTGLEAQVVEEDGNISAVVGTTVRLEVEANKELAAAWLSLSEDERADLAHTGRRAEGQLMVKKDGYYAVHIMDELGNENQDPIRYRIEAVADEFPMVQITFPGENVDLGEEMKLPLSLVAGDDFGLSRMELVHQKIREGEQFPEERWAIPLPKPDMTRVEMGHVWDLKALSLIPEDLVTYRVEVWDNDRISGPKKAATQTYTVRFPSIQEILAQVQEEQSLQIVDLEEILEEERVLKERLDQIRRELEIEDQMSWEQRKDVETALERQRGIAQQLAQMAEDMDQTLQRIQEKRLASVEIMEKMEQVRELMEEVATPEMREALEKLQKALQELDPELVRQQMEKFSITQEDFLKRLDRTLSILKRLQAEQRLDALVKRTEEMLQRQEHIRQQTGEVSEDELAELAKEQERLREDAEGLPDELESLSELMRQFAEMPSQELCEMAEKLEASELTEQMKQAATNLSMCSRKSAQKNQEKASELLSQLRNNLLMFQNQMGARMRMEVASAIKESVRDLLDISQEQERHCTQVKGLDRESTTFGHLAEGQLSLLEAASRVANDIYMAAQKTFFVTPQVGQALGQALAQMGQAMENLEGRNASSAARSEKAAMVSLNEAANQLLEALNAMSCSCSASGLEAMMQKLAGMSQGQMSINQQTLGMFQQSGYSQGEYSMEQRAQMARLAADQEVVRRGVEDLIKEFGNRSEILGRLDSLEEEMKKVVDDLAQSEVDQRTLDRQQKILSRLLDAQKSVRRRDYTQRRQSRPGQIVARSSPGELPEGLGEGEDQLRQDLLRALNEDYPKAYEDLIRAYFQALSQAQEP